MKTLVKHEKYKLLDDACGEIIERPQTYGRQIIINETDIPNAELMLYLAPTIDMIEINLAEETLDAQ